EARRSPRRHIHDHEWRCLRLTLRHADLEPAAERNSWHAQNHATPHGSGWESGGPPDDVSGAQLRSSRDRWKGSSYLPDKSEGVHRGSEKALAGFLRKCVPVVI